MLLHKKKACYKNATAKLLKKSTVIETEPFSGDSLLYFLAPLSVSILAWILLPIKAQVLNLLRKDKVEMKKRILSLLMAGTMAAMLLTGCGDSGGDAETGTKGGEQEPGTSGEGEKETKGESGQEGGSTGDSYSFAANIWGRGAYPLDIIVHADEVVAEMTGMKLDVADNQFTADKIISDLQSQLATKPDGVIMFSVVDTVLGNVKQLCDEQKVPYVLDTNFPSDPEVFESIKNDPLFIGGVAASPYEMGKELAAEAIKDGCKSAIILGAALGDYSHDQRILGFTEEFEANGGTVQQVMHCSDPSESTTKANDLVTANADVDCAYASGGDYLSALAAIKAGDDTISFKLYGTDVAPDLIDYIGQDVIQAMNGGNHVNGAIAMCLLINYLDGHQILGEDGKAPVLDYLKCYLITSENAAHFQKLYADESCFVTDEQFQSLLYRYNPDVSLETYDAFLKGYADGIYNLAE